MVRKDVGGGKDNPPFATVEQFRRVGVFGNLKGTILIDANHLFINAYAHTRSKLSRVGNKDDTLIVQEMALWIENVVEGFINFSQNRCIESGRNTFVHNPTFNWGDSNFLKPEGKKYLRQLNEPEVDVLLFDADLKKRDINKSFDAALYKTSEAADPALQESLNKNKQKILDGDWTLSGSELTQKIKRMARSNLPPQWRTEWGHRTIWVQIGSAVCVTTSEKGVDTKLVLEIEKLSRIGPNENVPCDFLGIITPDFDIAPAIQLAQSRAGEFPPCVTWTELGRRNRRLREIVIAENIWSFPR